MRDDISNKQEGCFHLLVRINKPPYRYRCEKCGKELKILSGILKREANTHAQNQNQ